jgi:nitrogen fixation protein NifU and related proteins
MSTVMRRHWSETGKSLATICERLLTELDDIVKELALPPVKIHCSVLAEDAIRAAIGDWKKKNNVTETEGVAVAAH